MFALYVVNEDCQTTKRTYKRMENAILVGSRLAANDNTLHIWVSSETQKVAIIYNTYNDPGYYVSMVPQRKE